MKRIAQRILDKTNEGPNRSRNEAIAIRRAVMLNQAQLPSASLSKDLVELIALPLGLLMGLGIVLLFALYVIVPAVLGVAALLVLNWMIPGMAGAVGLGILIWFVIMLSF